MGQKLRCDCPEKFVLLAPRAWLGDAMIRQASLLPNGRVLVVGGMDNTVPLRSAELYTRPDISGFIYCCVVIREMFGGFQ